MTASYKIIFSSLFILPLDALCSINWRYCKINIEICIYYVTDWNCKGVKSSTVRRQTVLAIWRLILRKIVLSNRGLFLQKWYKSTPKFRAEPSLQNGECREIYAFYIYTSCEERVRFYKVSTRVQLWCERRLWNPRSHYVTSVCVCFSQSKYRKLFNPSCIANFMKRIRKNPFI